MLHATKIRLIIDLCIQVILFALLLLQVILHPSAQGILYYASIFGIMLSAWQILHAVYVVKKYKDWQRKQYLYNMRQVLAYGLLTLGVGLFMILTSFGFLAPFFYFTVTFLHWVLTAVVLLLALNYFRISWKRFMEYIYRPKSFWDL